MSVTQKPLPGADSEHFLAISYPLDWEKTLLFEHSVRIGPPTSASVTDRGPLRQWLFVEKHQSGDDPASRAKLAVCGKNGLYITNR